MSDASKPRRHPGQGAAKEPGGAVPGADQADQKTAQPSGGQRQGAEGANSGEQDPGAQNEPDADTSPGGGGGGNDALLALEKKLAERDARLEATLSQYKEALDEFARVKARLTRDVAKEVQSGKRHFTGQLLDVLDNLERALEVALADPSQAKSPLCEGITMVRDQFHAKLASMGVKKLAALGQPFDPVHFEAVSTVPITDAKQDGHVIGVMRDAYLLDEETLRHGIVAVGKLATAP